MVFASDSRTNAGFDQVSTFRKMVVYERPDDRFMVLLSSGNLSITQSVREILQVERLAGEGPTTTIWNATSMFDAARVLGHTVRRVNEQEGPALRAEGSISDARSSSGARSRARPCASFSSTPPATSSKQRPRPAISRLAKQSTESPCSIASSCRVHRWPRRRSARSCRFDSTLKSNLSVGLPIDLLVYEAGALRSDRITCIDETNPYFTMIRDSWGQRLRGAFEGLDDPNWEPTGARYALRVRSGRYEVLRKITNPTEKLV